MAPGYAFRMSAQAPSIKPRTPIKVWDPLLRLCHWSLLVGFIIAYLTEDELLDLHVYAGYLVGGLVVFRLLWGLIGPRHARFTDFITGPAEIGRAHV